MKRSRNRYIIVTMLKAKSMKKILKEYKKKTKWDLEVKPNMIYS
jgi:hypothetical protein